MTSPLKIGISVCLMPPDPDRSTAASKTLQYIEQSNAEWVQKGGALPVLIPALDKSSIENSDYFEEYAAMLDGLVLHGGADVWPGHYGQTPLRPEWTGDAVRDRYEINLMRAFVAAGKPVFGICRGMQLINVAYGGTLHQDIPSQIPQAANHRDRLLYEHQLHDLAIVKGTKLAALMPGVNTCKVNSIHHQCIAQLAVDFEVEAVSTEDDVIEAIRHKHLPYLAGVQWHPEFYAGKPGVLNDDLLRAEFFAHCRDVQLS